MQNLWRGSLLPLDCEAVAKPAETDYLKECMSGFGAASLPSGCKLPRHSRLVAAVSDRRFWRTVG
ncbi:hypothetical protein EAH78_15365 [Pseudomonas arsenicoxydans]|uniref:Uncharacterized protein n=1 Tax=Pseudomonas arsenicoxydans TaxID=702115 RepID=A0A502HWB5_9PSED|nr:hypothetical protein EAH78_15365 [Pseudomonas arsenicoxydans]